MKCYDETEIVKLEKFIEENGGKRVMQSYRVPMYWIKEIAKEAKRIGKSKIMVIIIALEEYFEKRKNKKYGELKQAGIDK
jgi:hypothetical protein